mgnify:CR=1 FL=1
MLPNYEACIKSAWEELLAWTKADKIHPTCEEEIQCFLYHSLVSQIGDAKYIKPKVGFKGAARKQYFPDFILGQGNDVVVEIKFSYLSANSLAKQAGISACLRDIEKMQTDFPKSKRYFLLFETSEAGNSLSNLDEVYLAALQKADPDCNILHYPQKLLAWAEMNAHQKRYRNEWKAKLNC